MQIFDKFSVRKKAARVHGRPCVSCIIYTHTTKRKYTTCACCMQLLKYGRSAEEHGHDAPRCHLALELFLYRFVLGFIL